MRVNRETIIENISTSSGYSKKAVRDIVLMFEGAIQNELLNGNEVTLRGFGCFKMKHRAAYVGKAPDGSEAIHDEEYTPSFKAGITFKNAVKSHI